MSFAKSKLKLARDAIGKKDYATAQDAATQVLDYEPENYHAHVFLGLALLKLDHLNQSEQIYRKAIDLAPGQILAWQGLSQLYEQAGNWDKLLDTLENLAQLHQKIDDPTKLAEVVKKIIDVSRNLDDRLKLVKALSYLLTDSPFYPTLSKLPPPDPTNPTATTTAYVQQAIYNELLTLEEMVELVEKQESAYTEKEVERRRTRLGAGGPEQIRKEVGREVWAQSHLLKLYDQILNHPNTSDELRRTTESKLLHYKTNYLHSIPLSEDLREIKLKLMEEVDEQIRGVILLKIPNEFAWTLYMEEQDCETMSDYDFALIRQMIYLLPNSPLAKVLAGYLRYISEPVYEEEEGDDGKETEERTAQIDEDPFDSIMSVFSESQDKTLICRVVSEVYLIEEDYENASKVAKSGLTLLGRVEQHSGKKLPRTRVGFQAIIATALVHLFPPKHHQRALPILRQALSFSPNNIRCLFAHAYILQTAEDWLPAADVFDKIASLLSDDLDGGLKATEEQAWSHWRATHEEADIQSLRGVLATLSGLEGREHDTARCLWRIGKCLWDQGGEKREEAYTFFINSLKRDSSFAPAFTSLGFYYTEVTSPPDPVRASKCFQKAFELDYRENAAARKLAEGFAEDREWDLVEVVARRTIEGEGGIDAGIKDSGSSVIKFIPMNAWAWKAIGIIEMASPCRLSRQNYLPAIQAFQIALRAEPEDPLTWSRLGEVYSKAGRHAAAIKALHRALELDPENWLCTFLTGELKSEMGLFQDAIVIFNRLLEHRPDELSVLVALAQAYLSLGRTESREGYHVRAETSFLNAIDVALSIIQRHSGFGGLAWKVISDGTLQMCSRPVFQEKARADEISGTLKSLLSTERAQTLDLPSITEFESSESLAFLGISIHACSLRLDLNAPSSVARGSAWYDLAISLQFWCHRVATPKPEVEKRIVEAIKNALREDPSNDLYWIAYGNAHFSGHAKIAQHAYIKALELDSKNVITWTNLGFLCYHHGDTELANEALHRAQVTDPDCSLAWLGQALVAAANGHDFDAQTLLTHATSLTSSLPDIDAEYAIRVFYESRTPKRRTETQVDLIPCFFALDRYCSRRPNDASGLHLFALICEKIGHIDLAVSLVSRAIGILEAAYEESENETVERQFTIANTTLGRLLLSTGEYDRSLESFQTVLGLLSGGEDTPIVKETRILRVQAHLGLALGHFMLQNYQSSLNASQEALNIAGDDLTIKGQIMVLFTQTLWALGTEEMREAAKSQLLEYIAVDPENLIAINTLAGMGILTGDENLIDAALSEVINLPLDQRQELDINREVDYLLVQHHLSQGKIDKAVSVAQKEVLSEPGKPEPRIQLATLMIQKGERRSALALLAGTSSSGTKEDLVSTSTALVLHSVALCSTEASAQDKATSLREIQRAIMLRPFNMKSWRALGYIRSCAAVA
ncbi:protein prenylyltransferase [Macrolepiota fuliginosa MF-IS2]|uniref:Protein prenylyltransferase n=1 Tax=Macrolepiota fuliginosa MF-IS2 TaxID=1400762 RepID=A0A9P5XKK7_9AGAR|nr:protein prenylyltransferase [Macrolepiota fuliginosa MF-IS2]